MKQITAQRICNECEGIEELYGGEQITFVVDLSSSKEIQKDLPTKENAPYTYVTYDATVVDIISQYK